MELKSGKISIILIHYNTPRYLQTCIDSILTQTYPNIELIFIDNNSPDKSGLEFVRTRYAYHAALKIVINDENLGYGKAANQGIRLSDAEYLVITNPDIIYTPNYFEKIVERIKKDPKIAAITGKVYKYDFDRQASTNVIDTVGLMIYKNRRVIDDGQGLIDEGQFNKEVEVFGISGACPFYRREALEDVKVFDQYFDEDFFMYKEDVDLSWRFLLYGWKNLFYPQAIAYHGRGTGVYRRFFNKEVLKNRNKLSRFQKQHSFRNQYLMELKNDLWPNFFRNFFSIMLRKIGLSAYITFREPYLWKSFLQYLKQLPRALKKRKIIMQNKKVSAKDMQKWFQKQSRYVKNLFL